MFESFVADNYNFIDLNEFFDWAHCIFSNCKDPDDFIRFVSKEELFDRLSNKLIKCKDIDLIILREFIDNLTDDERKVFYYKNNLIEFIDDYPNIQDLYKKIFENVVNIITQKSLYELNINTIINYAENSLTNIIKNKFFEF